MMKQVDVLIVGSGAAGLNAALQLHYRGITDLLVLTDGLEHSTSINTGSDKQTYYKLALCGDALDAPAAMAASYTTGGAMHGDLALVEAAVSPRAFAHLVELGVPFPQDAFGQYVGYKTDHDPRQRATSIGPYTSRVMCERMIARVRSLGIPVREECTVVELLTEPLVDGKRSACGAVFVNEHQQLEAILARDIVFAVGGPGDLYRDSVYPPVHRGGIGPALLVGAWARSLPESQFGLASTSFRWNVSGSYMQALPRVVSTARDGCCDVREFLLDWFPDTNELYSLLFLKGYQWPFDAARVPAGSSLLDLLIYHEQTVKQRRVFLDYRTNPTGLDVGSLAEEARLYLEKSGAVGETPLERLRQMNPAAVELYRTQGIDLAVEMLEVAVSAQHNNGGLAADRWWRSENIRHLYPVGEVNGSHGVKRPGGSALNAGQVGGFRIAEYIAHSRYAEAQQPITHIHQQAAQAMLTKLQSWLALPGVTDANTAMAEIRARMSDCSGILRHAGKLQQAVDESCELLQSILQNGVVAGSIREQLYLRQAAATSLLYLDAVRFQAEAGVGSRGSYLMLADSGESLNLALPLSWRKTAENVHFRSQVLVSCLDENQQPRHRWEACRPVPQPEHWFERDWADFRDGKVFGEDSGTVSSS